METASVDFGPFTKQYRYSYYKNGLKKHYTDPQGTTYSYHYDSANRLSRIDIPEEGNLTVNAYRWNAPATVTLPGGVAQNTGHDSLMRTAGIQSTTPGGTVLLDYGYGYDAVGNITGMESDHGPYSYTYDAADRLKTADNPTLPDEAYTYDPVGNRLTATDTGANEWQYDDRDRLLDAVNVQYGYDANGAQTEKTVAGITRTRIYDLVGRLSEVRESDGSLIAAYAYDPMGRRIKKQVGSEVRYYLYLDEGLAGEYDEAGNLVAGYGYTPGSAYGTEPLWQLKGGVYGYYHRSHLGTPLMMTDKTNAVLWRARYPAFGEAVTTGVVESPLRFPGQYYDEETGLHQNYFRDYDPSIGRYVESDPIGLQGGVNTYGYVKNRPLALTDPMGLKAQICCKKIPWLPAAHCFVNEVEDQDDGSEICDDCKSQTRRIGLQGPSPWGSSKYKDAGEIKTDDPFDNPKESKCGNWNKNCDVGDCIDREKAKYPSPSIYHAVSGPNSNTFASTIAAACGLQKPGWGWPKPGWGDSPADPKPL